jgi:hypothetical protein
MGRSVTGILGRAFPVTSDVPALTDRGCSPTYRETKGAIEVAMPKEGLNRGTVSRFLLFAVAGVAFFLFWAIARPSFAMTESMTEWPQVLWFSATLLSLAVSLPVFGRMVGGHRVVQLGFIAGGGVGLSGIANVFEDGFGIDSFFLAFVSGMFILNVALLVLAIVIVRAKPGWYRLLAVIPAGTVAGIVLFVAVGGPVMLLAWLGAAAAAILPGGTPIPTARRTATP